MIDIRVSTYSKPQPEWLRGQVPWNREMPHPPAQRLAGTFALGYGLNEESLPFPQATESLRTLALHAIDRQWRSPSHRKARWELHMQFTQAAISTMTFHITPAIRAAVERNFADLGATPEDLAQMQESVMPDRGEPVAVIFRAGWLIALWHIAEDDIHFYDSRACRLRSISSSE